MTAKRAFPIAILTMAFLLTGCAAGPSDEELSDAALCLESIGMTDVQVENGEVLYTADPAIADLPTTKAAVEACMPGSTADSVRKAVTE